MLIKQKSVQKETYTIVNKDFKTRYYYQATLAPKVRPLS